MHNVEATQKILGTTNMGIIFSILFWIFSKSVYTNIYIYIYKRI